MKKLIIALVFSFLLASNSCKNDEKEATTPAPTPVITIEEPYKHVEIPFDSTLVTPFFVKYPKLKTFQPDLIDFYKKHQFHYVWYDRNRINEVGNLLYTKMKNLADEGVLVTVPYIENLDAIFQNQENSQKPNLDTELLISSLYFFYANKVFHGLEASKIKELNWYLPRKKQSYVDYLDSLLVTPSLFNKNGKEVLGQYYRLRTALRHYRQMEKNGGWNTIEPEPNKSVFKPGDSSQTIAQIRHRLFAEDLLAKDSKSTVYDADLETGILKYKEIYGNAPDALITTNHIASMNVPLSERIKTIMVNMERCRWISTDVSKANEFIVINIPSYRLTYFKNGKPVLLSKVVVGKALNKTVIFTANMKYIVFSPYWNVPKSILRKEILPAIAKNPNYLSQHNMEWKGNEVRQRPGPKNSLGLVKFMFPNSNNIYLHDTPSKNLFNEEKRAFSHGCIRIEKPKELAEEILKDDTNWTPEKIETYMNGGEEYWYTLKNKIPVYIGYFTAWVDTEGVIHFYEDVYDRDNELASFIFEK